jgi:hypothetical protein
MNYQKIYDLIIHQAQCRVNATASKRCRLAGYEKHHIIPKCAGGTNDSSNLVFLTPREHFICHALLVKFCNPEHLKALRYALGMMRSRGKIVSSRLYQFVREQHRVAIATDRLGKKHSEETKQKISAAHSGRKRSPEQCENIRKAQLGKILSEEHRRKLGDATRGRKFGPHPKKRFPKPKITCPHCGVTGGKPVMLRFHFDFCKSRS